MCTCKDVTTSPFSIWDHQQQQQARAPLLQLAGSYINRTWQVSRAGVWFQQPGLRKVTQHHIEPIWL
jgi:hypothetical protein